MTFSLIKVFSVCVGCGFLVCYTPFVTTSDCGMFTISQLKDETVNQVDFHLM